MKVEKSIAVSFVRPLAGSNSESIADVSGQKPLATKCGISSQYSRDVCSGMLRLKC
ncbi:Uncharacterized protein PFLU_2251 [Pseudomonas [fluorescens] SBW25]|uniref:Uncharacterized protein n=1 Tax=Pseudomonas fluorescens (strain SBW25) TaxID=216595 RepID=C3KAP2_PSEFS|nr:Uncharacterized protein PFLU_2251 [Pseudomonas fluorescens SBW25]